MLNPLPSASSVTALFGAAFRCGEAGVLESEGQERCETTAMRSRNNPSGFVTFRLSDRLLKE
ncbi:hypothetical protein [Bradyrhizobium sp. CB2312]|uniref:hypothetical protein n=1 Tax=Bradyrhizobium sp. CB2312 TaxID=3039155 RepID=UPI0024B12392|nr:hypothetical protein [Bradyrhizobium sp. CB2312]WFU73406.1 hypothetical protein QA642_04880 [Bradyrhizobium sp. CB2312]